VRIFRFLLPLACLGVFLVVGAGAVLPAGAQTTATNEWTWMGGSNTPTGALVGVYGTLGTPAAGNIPSGRTGAASWTDISGNFWIFGGYGTSVTPYFEDMLDDLWEFNPSTNEWAWMGGSYPFMGQPGTYGTLGQPAAGNWPGSRQSSATWTDGSGNFWLFGGMGYDANQNSCSLNDLWEFAPSTGYWAWRGGSTMGCASGVYGSLETPAVGNIPGGRWGANTWTDSKGNVWLFGGYGFDSNGNSSDLNDLWKLNLSTNEWTWMSGSNTLPSTTLLNKLYSNVCELSAPGDVCGQPGVYGSLRVAADENVPGGRDTGVSWTDSNGNLWLFAGEGFDSVARWGDLNDLWEFNPAVNQWTWMGGTTTAYGNAEYGTVQVPSAANIPASEYGAAGWPDKDGNIWIFGGTTGLLVPDTMGGNNDFWEFSPSANEWAWMGGAQNDGQPVYGTIQIPAAGNIPGGRNGATALTDKFGNLWLFGGGGSVPNTGAYLNDLWEYSASAPSAVPSFGVFASPATVTVAPGTSGTATATVAVGGGFDSPVGLTGSSNPPGLSFSFSPSSITTASASSSKMTVSVPYDFHPGIGYTVTLTGVSGNTTETANFFLNVPYPFSLAASPSTFAVEVGANSTSTSTITTTVAGGLPSPITLTASGQPAGVSVSFNPNSITGAGASRMTVSADSSVGLGSYLIFLDGTSGAVTEYTYIYLNVTTMPEAATPTFAVAGGTYATNQSVAISDATSGATVYYTTDGTTPTTSSTVYSGPIPVMATETIEAIAAASGYSTSAVATASYTINLPAAATPTFGVAAGTYATNQSVAINEATGGATIYYTTDGTTPTTGSPVYGGPIPVNSTETIEAIATASGYSTSTVATATYTIPQSFGLSMDPGSMTVTAGASGTSQIKVQDEGGFNGNVSFACSGLPAGAGCSFTTLTVPTQAGVSYTTLTVATSSTTAEVRRGSGGLFPGAAFAVLACCFGLRKRGRVLMLVLLAVGAVGLGVVSGCGGSGSGGSGGGTHPVTSTVTVTGTSGTLNSTATFTLTVN